LSSNKSSTSKLTQKLFQIPDKIIKLTNERKQVSFIGKKSAIFVTIILEINFKIINMNGILYNLNQNEKKREKLTNRNSQK